MQKASQLSKQHGFPSIEQVSIPYCMRVLRHSSVCPQSKWNQIKSSPKLKSKLNELKKRIGVLNTGLTVECDNFESIQLNIVTINLLIRYAHPIQSVSLSHRSVDLSLNGRVDCSCHIVGE